MAKQIEAGERFPTKDSIEYSNGSVVSKLIIKKPGGTVTMFAFDKDQELSEQSSPHEALVQVLDGTVEITIGGRIQSISAGESIVLPANIPHALKAVESFKMVLVMIKN